MHMLNICIQVKIFCSLQNFFTGILRLMHENGTSCTHTRTRARTQRERERERIRCTWWQKRVTTPTWFLCSFPVHNEGVNNNLPIRAHMQNLPKIPIFIRKRTTEGKNNLSKHTYELHGHLSSSSSPMSVLYLVQALVVRSPTHISLPIQGTWYGI